MAPSPLHVLGWRDDSGRALILVEAGADLNATGEMYETPLHIAPANENLELTSLLVRAGARGEIGGQRQGMLCECASGILGLVPGRSACSTAQRHQPLSWETQ